MSFEFDTLNDSLLKELADMNMNPVVQYDEVERVSTGSLAVDWAIGGGLPRGRYTMIYGEEGSGKSTLFFMSAAKLMKEDKNAVVALIETGGESTDMIWLHNLGVDLKRFVQLQPTTTEEALENLRDLIQWGRCSIICLDSIAAMASAAEVAGQVGDGSYAMTARLLSDYFKRDGQLLKHANIKKVDLETGEILGEEAPPAVVFINQVRDNLSQYGDPERLTGGRQLRHAMSVILRLKKPNSKEIKLDKEENLLEVDHNLRVKKSKVSPPRREVEYTVRADRAAKYFGVDNIREAVDLSIRFGLIESASGKSYSQGAAFLNGEEIPTDTNIKVPKGRRKYRYYIEETLYSNPEWYTKVMVNLKEYIAASRYTADVMTIKKEEESGGLQTPNENIEYEQVLPE